MSLRRDLRLGLSLVAAGLGISLTGVVGMVAGLGETTTGAASGTTAPTATSTTTTTRAAERPEEFLTALATAFRDGDTTFLFDRLHPAVIERYGEQACRTDLAAATDPTASIDVTQVQGTSDYDWTSDGQTTTIPNTAAVAVTRVSNGQTVQAVVHIALLDGRFRWFTDCTP